jgi:hypothetical protein
MNSPPRKPETQPAAGASRNGASLKSTADMTAHAPIGAVASEMVLEGELMRATGYSARSALAKNLNRNRIRYFTGRRGRIWTTRDLIRAAASVGVPEDDHQDIEF